MVYFLIEEGRYQDDLSSCGPVLIHAAMWPKVILQSQGQACQKHSPKNTASLVIETLNN